MRAQRLAGLWLVRCGNQGRLTPIEYNERARLIAAICLFIETIEHPVKLCQRYPSRLSTHR